MEMISDSARFKGSQDPVDCEGKVESDEDSSLLSTSKPIDTAINNKQALPLVSTFTSVMSCVFYTLCSVSMVLLNKAISADMSIEMRHRLPDFAVVLYQCLIAVILVEFARLVGWVDYPLFNFRTAKSWLPLNLLFVGMLCSGFISLVYVSVPMVTIFKNLSNLITVFGDWYLFGEKISWVCIIAILVMTVGAVLSAANDLEFNLYGYFWICLNCVFTSTYVLYMRFASTNIKLPRFGMVYYNNLLSAAILLPICIFHGDFKALGDTEIMTKPFILSNTLAGLIGFYLNFASLWCVSSTSATTYAIVGSLNKVPITIMGFVLFNAKMTQQGILYVTMATVGGFIYAYAKLPQNK